MGSIQKDKEKLLIEHPCLLFCEGADEKWFLIWYLKHLLQQSYTNGILENIQVVDFGGIKDLNKKLKLIQGVENFDTVKGIAVIRDAENDAVAAQKSVEDSIYSNGIDNIIVSSMPFYLFPMKDENGCWQSGTLEDLCLEIILGIIPNEMVSSKLLSHCNNFLDNVQMERGSIFHRRHKNLLHSYFSSTDKFVDFKIGEAAKAGAFDWESKKLASLRNFLFTLALMGERV